MPPLRGTTDETENFERPPAGSLDAPSGPLENPATIAAEASSVQADAEALKVEASKIEEEDFLHEEPVEVLPELPPTPTGSPTKKIEPPDARHREVVGKVEGILSKGLSDLYIKLPPGDRAAFKKRGEDLAHLITTAILES